MKIRVFRGKWLPRRKRKYINNLLQTTKPPNREELEKEAKEFEEYMLRRKKEVTLENMSLDAKISDERKDAEIERMLKISDKYNIPLDCIIEDIVTEFNLPREVVLKRIETKSKRRKY